MISFITPNYNGERWLNDCLSSVASQTATQDSIEMIIVDDGSADNSRNIIENYAKDIPGLRPIWHEHIGRPGELRNLAISMAMGSHVFFLDSDDFIGQETVERLQEFTEGDNSSDVVAFELAGLDRSVPHSMFQKTIHDADLVTSGLYKTLGIWKMIRKDFLDKNDIKFNTTIGRGDDVPFSAEVYLRASKISAASGYPFYTVRGRDDGTSITQKEWDHDKRIDIARKVAELASTYAKTDEIRDHFLIRPFNADTFEILTSGNISERIKSRLKTEIGPYWSKRVADLVYTNETRQVLTSFYGDFDE